MKELNTFLSFFKYYLSIVFSHLSGLQSTFSEIFVYTAESLCKLFSVQFQTFGTSYLYFEKKLIY